MAPWTARHPVISPALELPRFSENGDDSARSPARGQMSEQWGQRIDDLLAIRQLEDDWDGQGSPAPTVEVVDSALVLALLLRQEGVQPPSSIVQGVTGSVHFVWQPEEGRYSEIEVSGPYTADVFIHVAGQPLRHLQLAGSAE